MNNSVKDMNIPSVLDLKRKYAIEKALSWAVLLFFVVSDLAMVFFFFIVPDFDGIRIIFLSFALSFSFLLRDYSKILFRKRRRLNRHSGFAVANYSADELYDLLQGLVHLYKGKEVPTLYILDDDKETPFVIDILLINWIRPLNGLYIPVYLLNILSLDELKAVIGHELGHFYCYIFPLQRFIYPLYLFFVLLPFVLSSLAGADYSGYLFVTSFLGMYFVIQKMLMLDRKSLEFLADYSAAEHFGTLHYTNALLTLGRYQEVLERIERKILVNLKKSSHFKLDSFQKHFKEIVSLYHVDKNLDADYSVIVDDYFTQKERLFKGGNLSWLAFRQKKSLITKLLKTYYHELDTMNWSLFDREVHNHRISADAYDDFVKTLKSFPEKHLFNSIIDDEDLPQSRTHPALRRRILFLEKNCRQWL